MIVAGSAVFKPTADPKKIIEILRAAVLSKGYAVHSPHM